MQAALYGFIIVAALVLAPTRAGAQTSAPPIATLTADLSSFPEKRALRTKDCRGRLYGITGADETVHTERAPIMLVHGIKQNPGELQAIVDRLESDSRYQLYYFGYHSFDCRINRNAAALTAELQRLKTLSAGAQTQGPVIIAHSEGGIVSRQALNMLLTGSGATSDPFGPSHLIAVDTPWHGFFGPPDNGIYDVLNGLALLFMPHGLFDMRAASNLFQGNPHGKQPYEREGLEGPILPANTRIDLVFAAEGKGILNYEKGDLRELPEKIAAHYRDPTTEVTGSKGLVNYWKALESADAFEPFDAELETLSGTQEVTKADVLVRLRRYYPIFPGDHVGVLKEHPGQVSFLDDLTQHLLN